MHAESNLAGPTEAMSKQLSPAQHSSMLSWAYCACCPAKHASRNEQITDQNICGHEGRPMQEYGCALLVGVARKRNETIPTYLQGPCLPMVPKLKHVYGMPGQGRAMQPGVPEVYCLQRRLL